jgi:DNA replication and repair protein RecF
VVLVGDNGAGKTNLLVPCRCGLVTVCATPPPSLTQRRSRRIRFLARRHARRRVEIGTGFGAEAHGSADGRVVKIAGKERSPGALAEYVRIVWLIPAMDGLFTGSASERRRFLDRLVLTIDPKMRTPLARYDRAMRQRNRLFAMREGSPSLFEGLEEQMAEAGVAVAAARIDAISRLAWLIDASRAERGDGLPGPNSCDRRSSMATQRPRLSRIRAFPADRNRVTDGALTVHI